MARLDITEDGEYRNALHKRLDESNEVREAERRLFEKLGTMTETACVFDRLTKTQRAVYDAMRAMKMTLQESLIACGAADDIIREIVPPSEFRESRKRRF